MQNTLLKVENLEASIDNKAIIKKFNIEVKENEILLRRESKKIVF